MWRSDIGNLAQHWHCLLTFSRSPFVSDSGKKQELRLLDSDKSPLSTCVNLSLSST